MSNQMFNITMTIVSKMTSHGTGTVQVREESESVIRKWEEMRFKMTAKDGERGGSRNVQWNTVPQMNCLQHAGQQLLTMGTYIIKSRSARMRLRKSSFVDRFLQATPMMCISTGWDGMVWRNSVRHGNKIALELTNAFFCRTWSILSNKPV